MSPLMYPLDSPTEWEGLCFFFIYIVKIWLNLIFVFTNSWKKKCLQLLDIALSSPATWLNEHLPFGTGLVAYAFWYNLDWLRLSQSCRTADLVVNSHWVVQHYKQLFHITNWFDSILKRWKILLNLALSLLQPFTFSLHIQKSFTV